MNTIGRKQTALSPDTLATLRLLWRVAEQARRDAQSGNRALATEAQSWLTENGLSIESLETAETCLP